MALENMSSKDLNMTVRVRSGTPSLGQYEAWLDELDEKMYARDGWLISELGDTFRIPIHEVDSPEKLIAKAAVFTASIGDEVRDAEWYLVKRFYRLLDREHRYEKKFGLSIEQFAAGMKAA